MPPKTESEKKIYTETDLKKAYEFGVKYTKGTVGQAQEFTFERLLMLLKVTQRF
jgi:hypothetical protein